MPLEAPTVPADGFESFDVLYAHVNPSAKEQGYAIVKVRCSDYKNGAPRRYDLSCVHGANKKETRGVGLRDTSTIKTSCPWRAKAVQRVLAGDRWIFEVMVNQHNHEAQDPVAYPSHRKRTWTEAQKDKIRQIFKTTATGSRGVAALMRELYPDQEWHRRDIENEMTQANAEALGGYTPTQALIKHFTDTGIKHFVRQLSGHVTALIWTYPWCEKAWKRFPDVLNLDNTYKTNRFDMPFLNVTGVTNLHTTFNVAFAIVNKEDEEAYTLVDPSISKSSGVAKNCPPSKSCLWHVFKNRTRARSKRKLELGPDGQQPSQQALREQEEEGNHVDPTFRDLIAEAPVIGPPLSIQDTEDTPAGFLSVWKACVYASTIDDFQMAWQQLIDQFAEHQEPAVSYILSTYFPWRKHFLECFTRQNRNFGVRVTSRTEGSHKEVKSYLLNSRAELRFLASRVEQLVKDQEASYNAKKGEEATRQLGQYSSCRWMGDLRYRLSRKALGLVAQQHRICHSRVKSDLGQTASQRHREPPPECTGAFHQQFGLPCSHDIERKLRSNQELSYLDTHPHWHLEVSLAANDPFAAIEEPLVGITRRGRPTVSQEEILRRFDTPWR
ncbi:hypothetical protein CHGG_00207 [Chaetomium globosum CBS 148.51]|uniref:MULE transposase domain-containing protein n=1 Tax=Chaetomium globosum (strain ATCC 6205 / CBS 148.51 / DSM 1962 / NBRC 6347 / NRRL 1970) TaxID=306901 RepID=Q2HHU7_CHAGB|nr:uncharacterized protein CHGG_00207 [Chaetomium globosum CBS 148.51]EAQ91972.1 hypothetical protein CHGG_00207 [Chaetomium globosum CBS 148.51]